MKKIRIIPRLDIKNDTVVKGIQLEGLRVVGKPDELAYKYYKDGADELLYIDAVASLYERNSLTEIVKKAAKRIFVPLTVGGGIREMDDITAILNSGADKIAINTAGVRNPGFLKEAVKKFGSQCIVLSVQAKKRREGQWEAYTEAGREPSGRDLLEWVNEALGLGVGEVLLTSIDMDGTKKGFDMGLIDAVAKICTVPLIACGGAGRLEDILAVLNRKGVDAAGIGSALHYNTLNIAGIKAFLDKNNIKVRLDESCDNRLRAGKSLQPK